jgi:hypothetical protein
MKRSLTLACAVAAMAAAGPCFAAVTSPSEGRANMARELATMVHDPAFREVLAHDLSDGKATLGDVMRQFREAYGPHALEAQGDDLQQLEREVIRLRGLDGAVDALIELRANDSARASTDLTSAWIGTVVRDPVTGEKSFVAYDASGGEHRFALDAVPDRPMLIVESDHAMALQAGISVMNHMMQQAEGHPLVVRQPFGASRSAQVAGSADGAGPHDAPLTPKGEQLTLLKSIYLTDDHEPNIQGDAEVFAIVSGIGADGKAHLVTRDMPWLDHDKRWYRPNMDLVNWTEFGAHYVNIQFFEADGDTDFRKLASSVINAVGDLALLVSPAAPEALIVKGVSTIADKILQAMDDSWVRNDNDYIDSLYVVERGHDYGSEDKPRVGARGQVRLVLEPYRVNPR